MEDVHLRLIKKPKAIRLDRYPEWPGGKSPVERKRRKKTAGLSMLGADRLALFGYELMFPLHYLIFYRLC